MTRASTSNRSPVGATTLSPSLSAVMELKNKITGEDHRTAAAAQLEQPLLANTKLLYMTIDYAQDMLLPACLLPPTMQTDAAITIIAIDMSHLNSSSRAKVRFSMQSKVAHTARLHIIQQRQSHNTRIPVRSSKAIQTIGLIHSPNRVKMAQPMREDLTWQIGPRTAHVDLRCSYQLHRQMMVRQIVSKLFQRAREAARLLLCSSKRSWICGCRWAISTAINSIMNPACSWHVSSLAHHSSIT